LYPLFLFSLSGLQWSIHIIHLTSYHYLYTINTACECNIVSFISLLSFRLASIYHHPSDFVSHDLYTISQRVSAILYPLFLFSLSGLQRCTSSIWLHIIISTLFYTQKVSAILYPLFLFSRSGLHRSTYHPSDFISHDLYTILHSLWVQYCILYFSSLFQAYNDVHHLSDFISWSLHIILHRMWVHYYIFIFISLSFRISSSIYIVHLTSYHMISTHYFTQDVSIDVIRWRFSSINFHT
jgi:hypothetical protein